MRKIRVLALALILSVILMGAGYAAWTDTTVITNTVRTGTLNVKFDQSNFSGIKYPDACAAQYAKASADIVDKDSHTMQVQLNDLYPGSWAAFRVKGINAGTIPAKIDNIDVQFSGDKELLPYLSYETRIGIDPNGNNSDLSKFTISGKLSKFGEDINNYLKQHNEVKNLQLSPNNKGCFYIGVPQNGFSVNANCSNNNNNTVAPDGYFVIKFDKAAPNELQKKALNFTITVNFKQFNQ
ncbi:SipW-dependent-type signal peptide-containing protein [Clostridium folliculivorans]|uniref:SipW-dependent-type signal peptide-containing protein n=1 Tax=Clostridium folliculivorans TaxID=2886038 RepID=UPI0021C3090B|nr:SipW-dependent-type signal peptide-containing protein [Clostridium folliculivorans]GKU31619.1 hypothetical protein CFB3_37260 [Clostridium folliculivorans]